MKKLFVYHRPGQMKGHNFTDDVAITKAYTKKGAIEKFRKLYLLTDEEAEKYIDIVWFNSYDVSILTDY